jgi:Family of unknown function (DUF6516)
VEARLLFREHLDLTETAFVQMVVWKLLRRMRGSAHAFKFRLALISNNVCVLRYDNEAGKDDHKHIGERECPYSFIELPMLKMEFLKDVRNRRAEQ